MEIIESIAWVCLGFIPTLVTLELVSKRSHGVLSGHAVRAAARLKEGVAA